TLYVQIGSDEVQMVWDDEDPGQPAEMVFSATGDTDEAGVEWTNKQEQLLDNHTPLLLELVTATVNTPTFVVGDNTVIDGSITVFATVALLSSGTIQLQRQTDTGWETVTSVDYNVLAGVAGQVGQLDLTGLDLEPGTYRGHVTINGLAGVTLDVHTEVEATYLDQYVVEGVTGTNGNLFANDVLGSAHTKLQILDGSDYVDVVNGTVVDGTYGSLLVNADGSYAYTPYSDLAHFDTEQIDSFTYQLVHPVTGETQQAT